VADPRPWFPFYVADFLLDEVVALAEPEVLGIYIRLLCHQWREGSIPSNHEHLARITRCRRSVLERSWPQLSKKFEPDDGERLFNRRLDDERKKAISRSHASGTSSRGGHDGDQRFLYAATGTAFEGFDEKKFELIKIGWSRDPKGRMRNLTHPTLAVYKGQLLGFVPASISLERRAHLDLSAYLHLGEWFMDAPPVRAWLLAHGIPAGVTTGVTTGALPETIETGRLQSQSQSQPPTTATAPAASVAPEGTTAAPEGTTAAPSYPLACVVAANTALDALLAGGHKPLRADLEAPTAEAWQRDGVPLPVTLATIRDAVAHYRVRPGNRQPHSLRYFDGAVREAWERSRGALGAKPKPITDQPPPREPTPEEHLAHLERLAAAQAERAAQPRRRGNIGAIPLPERTAA
jgi:uncharacterized protein YdaU (DUF1376 family)